MTTADPDILQRFAAGSSVCEHTLEPGILNCLKAGKACNGYAIDQASTLRKRYGNFWVDLFNFRRQTDITGWRFNALIVLMGDFVVYASYGGQPSIHEHEATRNPLGPLQESGGSVIMRVVPAGGFLKCECCLVRAVRPVQFNGECQRFDDRRCVHRARARGRLSRQATTRVYRSGVRPRSADGSRCVA